MLRELSFEALEIGGVEVSADGAGGDGDGDGRESVWESMHVVLERIGGEHAHGMAMATIDTIREMDVEGGQLAGDGGDLTGGLTGNLTGNLAGSKGGLWDGEVFSIVCTGAELFPLIPFMYELATDIDPTGNPADGTGAAGRGGAVGELSLESASTVEVYVEQRITDMAFANMTPSLVPYQTVFIVGRAAQLKVIDPLV